MKTQAVVAAGIMSVLSYYATAGGMCSSRDGTQYCSCEYNKRCVSSESGCSCVLGEPGPLTLPMARNLGQYHPLPSVSPDHQISTVKPPKSAPPKLVSPAENKTPRDYVQLAEVAVLGADIDGAIALIDKARMRLLDQSAASNDADPAIYKTIRELSAAKRLLSAEDYTGSLRSLDTALGSLRSAQ